MLSSLSSLPVSRESPLKNPDKRKSGLASSGSMVSRQIIQFKCVVIGCDQDFGVFCRERDLQRKKRFGEQPGATKPAPGHTLGQLVEVDGGSGGATRIYGVAPWISWNRPFPRDVARATPIWGNGLNAAKKLGARISLRNQGGGGGRLQRGVLSLRTSELRIPGRPVTKWLRT